MPARLPKGFWARHVSRNTSSFSKRFETFFGTLYKASQNADTVKQHTATIRSLRTEIRSLENDISALQRDNTRLEAEKAHEILRKEKELKSAMDDLERIKGELDAERSRAHNLFLENERLEQEVEDLKVQVKTLGVPTANLRAELRECRGELAREKFQTMQLKEDLEKSRANEMRAVADNARSEIQCNKLRTDLATARGETDTAREVSDRLREDLEDEKTGKEFWKQAFDTKTAENKTLRSEKHDAIRQLEKQSSEAAEVAEQLQRDNDAQKTEIDRLKTKMKTSKAADKDKVKSAADKAVALALQESEQVIRKEIFNEFEKQWKANYEQINAEWRAHHSEQIAKYTAQVQEECRANTDSEAKLAEEKTAAAVAAQEQAAKAESDTLRAKVDELERQAAEAQKQAEKEMTARKQAAKKLAAQKEAASTAAATLETKVADLEKRLAASQQQAEDEKKAREQAAQDPAASGEVNTLRKKVAELESQVAEQKGKLETFKANYEALEKESLDYKCESFEFSLQLETAKQNFRDAEEKWQTDKEALKLEIDMQETFLNDKEAQIQELQKKLAEKGGEGKSPKPGDDVPDKKPPGDPDAKPPGDPGSKPSGGSGSSFPDDPKQNPSDDPESKPSRDSQSKAPNDHENKPTADTETGPSSSGEKTPSSDSQTKVTDGCGSEDQASKEQKHDMDKLVAESKKLAKDLEAKDKALQTAKAFSKKLAEASKEKNEKLAQLEAELAFKDEAFGEQEKLIEKLTAKAAEKEGTDVNAMNELEAKLATKETALSKLRCRNEKLTEELREQSAGSSDKSLAQKLAFNHTSETDSKPTAEDAAYKKLQDELNATVVSKRALEKQQNELVKKAAAEAKKKSQDALDLKERALKEAEETIEKLRAEAVNLAAQPRVRNPNSLQTAMRVPNRLRPQNPRSSPAPSATNTPSAGNPPTGAPPSGNASSGNPDASAAHAQELEKYKEMLKAEVQKADDLERREAKAEEQRKKDAQDVVKLKREMAALNAVVANLRNAAKTCTCKFGGGAPSSPDDDDDDDRDDNNDDQSRGKPSASGPSGPKSDAPGSPDKTGPDTSNEEKPDTCSSKDANSPSDQDLPDSSTIDKEDSSIADKPESSRTDSPTDPGNKIPGSEGEEDAPTDSVKKIIGSEEEVKIDSTDPAKKIAGEEEEEKDVPAGPAKKIAGAEQEEPVRRDLEGLPGDAPRDASQREDTTQTPAPSDVEGAFNLNTPVGVVDGGLSGNTGPISKVGVDNQDKPVVPHSMTFKFAASQDIDMGDTKAGGSTPFDFNSPMASTSLSVNHNGRPVFNLFSPAPHDNMIVDGSEGAQSKEAEPKDAEMSDEPHRPENESDAMMQDVQAPHDHPSQLPTGEPDNDSDLFGDEEDDLFGGDLSDGDLFDGDAEMADDEGNAAQPVAHNTPRPGPAQVTEQAPIEYQQGSLPSPEEGQNLLFHDDLNVVSEYMQRLEREIGEDPKKGEPQLYAVNTALQQISDVLDCGHMDRLANIFSVSLRSRLLELKKYFRYNWNLIDNRPYVGCRATINRILSWMALFGSKQLTCEPKDYLSMFAPIPIQAHTATELLESMNLNPALAIPASDLGVTLLHEHVEILNEEYIDLMQVSWFGRLPMARIAIARVWQAASTAGCLESSSQKENVEKLRSIIAKLWVKMQECPEQDSFMNTFVKDLVERMETVSSPLGVTKDQSNLSNMVDMQDENNADGSVEREANVFLNKDALVVEGSLDRLQSKLAKGSSILESKRYNDFPKKPLIISEISEILTLVKDAMLAPESINFEGPLSDAETFFDVVKNFDEILDDGIPMLNIEDQSKWEKDLGACCEAVNILLDWLAVAESEHVKQIPLRNVLLPAEDLPQNFGDAISSFNLDPKMTLKSDNKSAATNLIVLLEMQAEIVEANGKPDRLGMTRIAVTRLWRSYNKFGTVLSLDEDWMKSVRKVLFSFNKALNATDSPDPFLKAVLEALFPLVKDARKLSKIIDPAGQKCKRGFSEEPAAEKHNSGSEPSNTPDQPRKLTKTIRQPVQSDLAAAPPSDVSQDVRLALSKLPSGSSYTATPEGKERFDQEIENLCREAENLVTSGADKINVHQWMAQPTTRTTLLQITAAAEIPNISECLFDSGTVGQLSRFYQWMREQFRYAEDIDDDVLREVVGEAYLFFRRKTAPLQVKKILDRVEAEKDLWAQSSKVNDSAMLVQDIQSLRDHFADDDIVLVHDKIFLGGFEAKLRECQGGFKNKHTRVKNAAPDMKIIREDIEDICMKIAEIKNAL